MDIYRVKIERDGDGFTVATSRNGNGWWGCGIGFTRLAGARQVAAAMVAAIRKETDAPVEVEEFGIGEEE